MRLKRIEDMNCYEILNVRKNASQREIERAYLLGKAAYQKDSLAHYSLLEEKESEDILEKIEEAFRILGDPEKKRIYDSSKLKDGFLHEERVQFRKSTEKMTIEDGEPKRGILAKVRNRLSRPKKDRNIFVFRD